MVSLPSRGSPSVDTVEGWQFVFPVGPKEAATTFILALSSLLAVSTMVGTLHARLRLPYKHGTPLQDCRGSLFLPCVRFASISRMFSSRFPTLRRPPLEATLIWDPEKRQYDAAAGVYRGPNNIVVRRDTGRYRWMISDSPMTFWKNAETLRHAEDIISQFLGT
jgi:hypothetical protein